MENIIKLTLFKEKEHSGYYLNSNRQCNSVEFIVS